MQENNSRIQYTTADAEAAANARAAIRNQANNANAHLSETAIVPCPPGISTPETTVHITAGIHGRYAKR